MALRRQTKKSSSPRGGQRTGGKTSGKKRPARPGTGGGHKSTAARKPGQRRPKAASARTTSPRTSGDAADREPGDRLQKILAAAGFGSRRACEELILEGRVEVDRKFVTELGAKADSATQEIRVDGEVLRRQQLVYYAAHKPKGVVSTSADPSGRPRVTDLVPDRVRVFTVGRLDRESEGLVLLTNDGELANRLTHPRHGVEKVYQVQVAGLAEWEQLKKLREGIHLAEGSAKVKYLKIIKQHKQSTLLEIILDEGRNREIRRVLARLGHKVQHLKRVAIGTLRLGMMPPGEYRPLSRQEVRELKDLAAGRISSRRATTTPNDQGNPPGRPKSPPRAQAGARGQRPAANRKSTTQKDNSGPGSGRPASGAGRPGKKSVKKGPSTRSEGNATSSRKKPYGAKPHAKKSAGGESQARPATRKGKPAAGKKSVRQGKVRKRNS